MKAFFAGMGVLCLVLALSWILVGNSLFQYVFFAPKYEAARRQVFEHTRSYNQGMIQELQNMQFQYEQADKDHKAALASIILHRASGYDLNDPDVPSDLRAFIESLQHNQEVSR